MFLSLTLVKSIKIVSKHIIISGDMVIPFLLPIHSLQIRLFCPFCKCVCCTHCFFFLHALKAVNHLCTHTQSTHNNYLSLLKVWGGAQEVGPALGSLVKQFLVKFNRRLWFKPPLPSQSISSVVIPVFSCCTLSFCFSCYIVLCRIFSFPLPHPSFFIYSFASFLHSPLTFYGTSVFVLTNLQA